MFQRLDVVGFASDERQTAYWLYDTEFNESFSAKNHPSSDKIIDGHFIEIILNINNIYVSRNNDNISYNIFLFMLFLKKEYDFPNDAFISTKNMICKTYPQYLEDIEKYMVLI